MMGERRSAGNVGGPGFLRLAYATLVVNLAVVLWGAFVRATGSGAGCGSHWPLCNGEIVPRDPGEATLIEYVHRLGSALALVLVVALWIWTQRRFERGAPARRWAWASLAFILAEAAVGAGLVLMRWVGEDASVARAASIAFHLALTYALLASLVLVAWYGSPRPRPAVTPGIPRTITALLVAAMIVLGMTGAITALGDTLFPASSLVGGIVQDVSPGVHFLLRLRLLHPFLALAVAGGAIVWADGRRRNVSETPAGWRLTLLRGTLLVQLAIGAANVMLLAPLWLQMSHLLLADAAWLLMIVCLAEGQAAKEARTVSTIG